MYACPRCESPLTEAELAGHDIMRCPTQCGLIIEQRSMVPVTDALAKASLDAIDLDEPITPMPCDPSQTAICPGCQRKMELFGYLGTRFVFLDRCSACQVLWIDTDELETVIRMVARNLRQLQRQRDQRQDLAQRLTRLVWIGNADGGYIPI